MRVGIISFVDGRARMGKKDEPAALRFQSRTATWLESEGHEVTPALEAVMDIHSLRRTAAKMSKARVDAVIFNFAVWTFPDFPVQAARLLQKPLLLIGNLNPSYPGWVAFFASVGALEECDVPFTKVLGGIEDAKVQAAVRIFLARHRPTRIRRGEAVARSLFGMRYGEFDGPSMGMYTGHIDQSQWMRQFGVHVYHLSQLSVVNRAEAVHERRVRNGLEWLEAHAKEIQWNTTSLRRGLKGQLARQVRLYLALKDICKEESLDFCGLTGQLDLTEDRRRGCTGDIAEAILNDIADWEEIPKKPVITATECDSNGALTMQVLHLITREPVLFADLRHYHKDRNLFDLVNSGQHVPYLARRSMDFRENWKEVVLTPANDFWQPGGGAYLHFHAAPAEKVTFARIVRQAGRHKMFIFTGRYVQMKYEEMERLARQTTYEWPHVWAQFDCNIEEFTRRFSSNHIHAAIGDLVAELLAFCRVTGVEPVLLD